MKLTELMSESRLPAVVAAFGDSFWADRRRVYAAWIGVSLVALMAVTWPLWFPTAEVTFPMIPLVPMVAEWPWWIDWIASLAVLAGWIVAAFGKVRLGCGLASLASMTLVILNQHRLQPWFYEFLLVSILFSLASADTVWKRWMRYLVASIYIYSAVSKLDVSFLETLGPSLVIGGGEALGIAPDPDASWPAVIAHSAPLYELAVGMCLAWPPLLRVGAVMGILLHLGILLAVGPWGLQHSTGVLLWNGHFIGLLGWWLWKPQDAYAEPQQQVVHWRACDWVLAGVLLPPLVLPVTEHGEWWDHWPSWAVYAPHCSKAQVYVPQARVQQLPEGLQRLLARQPWEEGAFEVELPLAAWSLAETHAPLYPQARFQVGVARAVAERIAADFGMRCVVWSPAGRLSGKRKGTAIASRRELVRFAARRYWLGTRPRQLTPPAAITK